MAKGHRSQIKRARNESNRETRPSAKLSYARISVQKACYVISDDKGTVSTKTMPGCTGVMSSFNYVGAEWAGGRKSLCTLLKTQQTARF